MGKRKVTEKDNKSCCGILNTICARQQTARRTDVMIEDSNKMQIWLIDMP